MNVLKAIYHWYCVIEETIVAVFLAAITLLIFISALARAFGSPINWAADFSMLLLAWVVFLGADTALRRADFIRVDVLIRKLPQVVQKILYYVYYIAVILFLGLLIRFGIPLSIENSARTFQALTISYSWATMSVPVGAFAMLITIVLKLINKWNEKEIVSQGKEAI